MSTASIRTLVKSVATEEDARRELSDNPEAFTERFGLDARAAQALKSADALLADEPVISSAARSAGPNAKQGDDPQRQRDITFETGTTITPQRRPDITFETGTTITPQRRRDITFETGTTITPQRRRDITFETGTTITA